jgi:cytochrome P450
VRDTEIGGHQIRAGDKVLMYWTSADRDEAEFVNPDTFMMDRARNRHLTFGVGIHRCAGSNLARMNMRIALEEIVHRLEDLRLEDGAHVGYHVTFTRAPLAVPIVFKPGRPTAAA